MIDSVTVVRLGEPVAFARTRRSRSGALFTPDKQRRAATDLGWAAREAMGGRPPFDCAVRVDLRAEFGVARSWPERKRTAALLGEIRPTKVPDISNIAKLVEDALNGIVFRDDALIVEYGTLCKVYSNQPKVAVTISPVHEAAGITL